MKRIASKLFPVVCVLLSSLGMSASVETVYHESIAGRTTGTYELNGTVYFQTLSVRGPSDDDSACRRRAMLAVRKMMVEWIAKHAPSYETLPETIKKIDALCSVYGSDITADSFSLHVSGQGFTAETDKTYAYGFAAPLDELRREANKGAPGKTEADIVARWRRVCEIELGKASAHDFLAKVGCGDLRSVPKEFAEKIPAECAFLDGWDQSSRIVGMLKTTGRIDLPAEDLWMEGLNLISDLKERKVRLADSGKRLHEALQETPGSSVLWCYFGAYLKEKRLYRLSAVAYKNAYCLSTNIGLFPLLRSSSGNLAHVYRALHCDVQAGGFVLLSIGLGK